MLLCESCTETALATDQGVEAISPQKSLTPSTRSSQVLTAETLGILGVIFYPEPRHNVVGDVMSDGRAGTRPMVLSGGTGKIDMQWTVKFPRTKPDYQCRSPDGCARPRVSVDCPWCSRHRLRYKAGAIAKTRAGGMNVAISHRSAQK
jgi:hypothetical protein